VEVKSDTLPAGIQEYVAGVVPNLLGNSINGVSGSKAGTRPG